MLLFVETMCMLQARSQGHSSPQRRGATTYCLSDSGRHDPGSHGAPVGVPVHAEGGKVTVQASAAQGVHAAMVLEPVPGAVGASSGNLKGDCKLGGMKSENKYKHKTWL